MNKKLKFIEDAEPFAHGDGFWYSITLGGYLNPGDYLEDQEDIDRVYDAVDTLMDFQRQMNDAGLIEEM